VVVVSGGRALVVLVQADEHPERDEWVDDRAREAQRVVQLVAVDAGHYRGVWVTPMGSPVHVFAAGGDLIRLETVAGYIPPRCPECDCRVFPQDGPGVHAARCPYGWARYGRCEQCRAMGGERCIRPGLWPHAGRPLSSSPLPWGRVREAGREALR
jgi:hypothetical protein